MEDFQSYQSDYVITVNTIFHFIETKHHLGINVFVSIRSGFNFTCKLHLVHNVGWTVNIGVCIWNEINEFAGWLCWTTK